MKINRYISRAVIIAALPAILSACDDNSWNDHELEGFEEPAITNEQAIEYTLTPNDYKIIADNATNKALAGDALKAALAAVGTQGYFTEEISPRDYAPALFSDPKFPYFTLSDGSSVKLTYRIADALPTGMTEAVNALRYTVTDEDYQKVWGSDNNYTPAFAPSHTAAASLPSILAEVYPDAESGDVVIVNYQTSQTDPVFTAPAEPDTPEFPLSNVLTGSPAKGDDITINGYVVATSTQGPVVADEAGTVFVYSPSNNADLKIGDQVVINSTIDTYNNGYQIARGADATLSGSREVTYPEPKAMTAAEIDALAKTTTPIWPVYARFTGKVSVSGNYINIALDGTSVQLSPYGASDETKSLFTDGETVTVEGYVVAIASKGKYLNTIVTKVGSATAKATATTTAAQSRAVTVASDNVNAVYSFNGSKWSADTRYTILSHADYQLMGQRYDNLSDEAPATMLPTYLCRTFPYAAEGDTKLVVYFYFASSTTTVRCDAFKFDGTGWIADNGVTTQTAQFVRTGGKWIYDPNVTITLPAGRSQPLSTLYFQACVDWVKNNIDTPTGATYVNSYGDNEYYSGTSAYQGNVDLRPSAARTQYAAGYADMTDEQVVAAMKKRFETEVMPGALSALHPDADVMPGLDVFYTINFSAYTGTTTPYTIKFKVVGKGKFEFVECDW
ncbi:MAG: hypothetical protein K2M85_09605 [Paramuribaculum sp.]|nr:hypothetical protein [Paramuribaculum sp.]